MSEKFLKNINIKLYFEKLFFVKYLELKRGSESQSLKSEI